MKGSYSELLTQAATCMSDQTHPIWNALASEISEEVLHNAWSKTDAVRHIYAPHVGSLFIGRPCKNMDRIRVKLTTAINKFKVVSDHIAFRIPCEVQGIPVVISALAAHTPADTFFTRPSNGPDIVQYAYAYRADIGHIVEFQVGHPFAAYTFKVDSALRDNPNCGLIDVWKDGVYNKVKDYLLARATNTVQAGQLYEMLDAIHNLYGQAGPPEELKLILSTFT
jgi:hypothetical protein